MFRVSQVNPMYKNVQKRAKTCISSTYLSKNVHLKVSFTKKRAKTCKNVYLKCFWTLFKNVHCQGPCILRPFISRPYCTGFFLILGLSRTYMEKVFCIYCTSSLQSWELKVQVSVQEFSSHLQKKNALNRCPSTF